MPFDPPEKDSALEDGNIKWLLQFYHTSKPSELSAPDPTQPLPELIVLPPGKYRVGAQVGSGGMKSVLRTHDRSTEREVAMAVMRDSSLQWKKIARFVREARITAALEHPNIVPVYDIGLDEDNKPYFTMKLLGGETLESILQRIHAGQADYLAQYPLNSLLRIFQGVCHAVAFAHARGVIHLDLKPSNIQVGDFGEVLVLDWGLAKVFDKDPTLHPQRLGLDAGLQVIPAEGTVSGTPGFMSPEQARGENTSLDERTDIFALGAILFTILNCRNAPEKSAEGTRRENRRLPVALEAVVTKAMSDLPANRYQTVEELALDVQAYVDGFATKAQQAGVLTLLWLLIKRHHVVASLAAVSLVTVCAILATSFIKIRHSEQAALRAQQSAEDALAKYKAEQESKHRVGLLAAPHLMLQAKEAIQRLDYDRAAALLENAVTLDQGFLEAWWYLASLRLGLQEFKEAATAFSHLPKRDAAPQFSGPVDLEGVLDKYSRLVRGQGDGALDKAQGDFVTDIINAGHTAWPFRQLALGVYFKNRNRNPKTVDFATIEKALRLINPGAADFFFAHEETPMGLKITLHGEKVTEICPLAGLPVSVLDVSGTGTLDLQWLYDAPFISIDLSRSATWDIHPLIPNATLQELRLVGWRNKDYARLFHLPKLKRLIVDSADVATAASAMQGAASTPQITGE